MAEHPNEHGRQSDDVDAVTSAVLTASRLLVAISARSIAAIEERVTLAQFRMLVVLAAHGAMKLATLADYLAVNPSTAMRMAVRLTTSQLIDRKVNPNDRRETVLCLTESGRRTVEEVTARRREEIAAIVTRMPADQRAGMVTALRAFTDAGGEPNADASGRDVIPLGWD